MAQNGLRPPFLGVSRAKKHPKIFPGRPLAGPDSGIAPERGCVTFAGNRWGERERERGENRDDSIYRELGNLGEPN